MQLRNLSPASIRTILGLIAVVILGTAFRLWGIDFGLPYMYHPDEPVIVITAQNILRSGDLNPHFYLDPPFFIYLNALVYIPYLIYTRNVGGITKFSEIISPRILVMGTGYSPQSTTILIGRLLTCCFSLASIVLLFFLAKRYARSSAVGLLAALFLAISPGNIVNSKIITPDAHFVFFALLAAWFSMDIFDHGRMRDYLMAGSIIGLAAGVKYNGALIAVLPIAAHILRHGVKSLRFFPRLFAAGAVSITIFCLTNPFAILDFENFYQGVRFEALHYASGHAGMEGNTLIFYFTNLWQEGGLAIVLGAIGAGQEVVRRKKSAILLASFPLFFFFFISLYAVRNEHTALSITPFLLLFASVFIVELWQTRIREQWKLLLRGLLLILTLCAIIISVSRSITRCVRSTIIDSRETAQVWIEQNLPEGSTIVLEAYSPYVDPTKYTVFPMDQLILRDIAWYEQQDVDYVIASAGMFQRFYNDPVRYASQISQYEQLFNSFELVKTFLDGNFEVRVYNLR